MSRINIIDKSKILEINKDKLIKFKEKDHEKYNKMAKQISYESGVPKESIYQISKLFRINNWHKINDEWYYYKGDNNDTHLINELLGEVISEYFDLDTIHYNVAKLCINGKEEQLGLASKSFCNKDSKYKKSWDYDLNENNDLSVLEDIKKICNSDSEYLLLLDDMKKWFIRDFYTTQLDRSANNFFFKVTNGNIRLGPLFDYEHSFISIEPTVYQNQIATLDIKNKKTQQFLTEDSRFQELLNQLMNADIEKFISTVEERHNIGIPKEDKEYYKDYEDNIKKLVLENKLVK